ncbi:MAG: ABC transporter permease [Mycobacteriales bacterium]
MASSTAQVRANAQSRLRWELLSALVRKDLKVKYKDSSLGFAWSLANPLLLLVVYYFVFAVVLKSGIHDFVVYLMSGLLIWNFFSSALLFSVGSVVGNGNLIRKVRFPLSVLPLSSVGFALVHFSLQILVLVVILLIVGYHFIGLQLLLVFPAFAVGLTFTVALALIVASLNVRYRDVQHILEVAMQAWFWVTPMVYPAGQVAKSLHHNGLLYRLYFADPMAAVVASFQRAIYAHPFNGGLLTLAAPGYAFYLEQLAVAMFGSLVLLWVGVRVFRHLQGDFAEDL